MKAIAKEDVESRRVAVPPRPGDEINLAEYAATSWRYRWVIAGAVLAAAVLTYVVNKQMTPTYEATVRLLATESQVGDEQTSRAISVARFRELLVSPSLVASVLQEFNLSAPPHALTPQGFLNDHLDVEEIPDTGILQASIQLTDRDVLVKLANRYAQAAVNLAERLNQDETVYARDQIKVQADQARKRLTEAQTQLEDFRRKTQIELLRKDVESVLAHRSDVLNLQVDIQTERAQLRQAEIELSRQERVRDVRSAVGSLPGSSPSVAGGSRADPAKPRPPDVSPVWGQPMTPGATPGQPATPGAQSAGQPAAPLTVSPRGTVTLPPAAAAPLERDSKDATPARSPDLPIRSDLTDPYVNPVYEILARDVAQARARLAGLEGRRQQLVNELKLSAPSSAKLNALYAAETQLAHLIGEYDVARTAYMNASSKYEEARLQITVRSPRLQILDSALPPEQPVAPNIPRNVAAAILLALTFSVAGVLLFDSSRQVRA